MTRHTYDYGLIGNCSFLALIKTDTSIDWMCWPRFDSSFIFGGLLDKEKGGEEEDGGGYKGDVRGE